MTRGSPGLHREGDDVSTKADREAVERALFEGANPKGFSGALRAAYDELTAPKVEVAPEPPPPPPPAEAPAPPEPKRRLRRRKATK
jgi:hypothetical protein